MPRGLGCARETREWGQRLTGAQQIREKRRKTRGDAYGKRPADAPSNSPVPKYCWLAQHALILSRAIVLKAMWSLRPSQLPGEQGVLLNHASITKIAAATVPFLNQAYGIEASLPMPRRTVAHCLESLERTRFLDRWETATSAKNSPFGTSWRILRFSETLQCWADDPNIGTVGKKRAYYVIGKGKRHMSPAEIEAWNLNHAVAESNPAAHASRVEIDEPAPPAPAKPPEEDLEPLKDALIAVCGTGEIKDARYVFSQVLKQCGARPVPSVQAVAGMVVAIGDVWRKVGNRAKPVTIELIRMKIGGRVEAWQVNIRDLAQSAVRRGG